MNLFVNNFLFKETNENSLKLLSDYINEAKTKNNVKPVTVNFFLRTKVRSADELADKDGNSSFP